MKFDGGEHAEILSADGPVLDYNVMSRDSAVEHELKCVTLGKEEVYSRKGDYTLVTVFSGCRLVLGGDAVRLAEYDSVLIKERDDVDFIVESEAPTTCMLVTEVWKK